MLRYRENKPKKYFVLEVKLSQSEIRCRGIFFSVTTTETMRLGASKILK
mgnify:CR=1 FL=1